MDTSDMLAYLHVCIACKKSLLIRTRRGYRLIVVMMMAFILSFVYLWRPTPVVLLQARPVVFVGGHPRSGTTLLRVMLDVHPMIRCGPETHILPAVLMQRRAFSKANAKRRLIKAGLYPTAINEAYVAFIRTLLRLAGKDAPVLCNKDPLTLGHINLLAELLPTAKFILMVRDGRAVVNSLRRRGVRIGSKVLTPTDMFRRWENITWIMLKQCDAIGRTSCLVLRYEDLVLRPKEQMEEVLSFIGVPWDSVVLKHDQVIGEETVLSSMEPSTSQVQYPINTAPLYSWAWVNSTLPEEIKINAHLTSSLLKRLNYASFPPNYGTADLEVEERTAQLARNPMFRANFFDFIK